MDRGHLPVSQHPPSCFVKACVGGLERVSLLQFLYHRQEKDQSVIFMIGLEDTDACFNQSDDVSDH